MQDGVDSVVPFITVNDSLNCNVHSSIATCASGRSYHQNVLVKMELLEMILENGTLASEYSILYFRLYFTIVLSCEGTKL